VQHIVEQELGGQRGWIGDQFRNVALSAATVALRHGLRRRIMEAMALFIGDVLVYLARRNAILEELEKTVAVAVAADEGPLWLVGHSLGGIMCFDYCCTTNRDVERLVTVGSQVGLFGEFGALQQKPLPARDAVAGPLETPARVGRWLNLYDPDDILSFLAQPVFKRVVDIEIDTKAPFPASHNEYWNLPVVYEKMTA
jgi:pimeloyl-ACP methyl ester carboxylesterase